MCLGGDFEEEGRGCLKLAFPLGALKNEERVLEDFSKPSKALFAYLLGCVWEGVF